MKISNNKAYQFLSREDANALRLVSTYHRDQIKSPSEVLKDLPLESLVAAYASWKMMGLDV